MSDTDWASFLATEVTPRFPSGFSVFDAAGQYREPSGAISREPSKMVVIVVFDTPAYRAKVSALVDAYLKRFRQHEVLRTEKPVCAGKQESRRRSNAPPTRSSCRRRYRTRPSAI